MGYTADFFVMCATVAGILGLFCVYCWVLNSKKATEVKRLQKALAEEQARQADTLRELKMERIRNEKILSAEQKRIAYDLHDDTVQRMVAIRLRMEQLTYLPLPERAHEEVKWMRHELNDAVDNLRYLIKGMVQPKFHQFDFSYLFEQLIREVGAMHHVKIECSVPAAEDALELAPVVKQNLYYIVQEVCHNFLKNSLGFRLRAELIWNESLQITIRDNGQGFLPGRQFGLGMLAMEHRARAIRALLNVRRTTEGLVTTITYPAPETE